MNRFHIQMLVNTRVSINNMFLMSCVRNISGLSETSIFPNYDLPICSVHSIAKSPFIFYSSGHSKQLEHKQILLIYCLLCSYMLMRECWQPDQDKRPFFTELREKLESQLKRADSEVYTDQMSENMYEILEDLPGEKC